MFNAFNYDPIGMKSWKTANLEDDVNWFSTAEFQSAVRLSLDLPPSVSWYDENMKIRHKCQWCKEVTDNPKHNYSCISQNSNGQKIAHDYINQQLQKLLVNRGAQVINEPMVKDFIDSSNMSTLEPSDIQFLNQMDVTNHNHKNRYDTFIRFGPIGYATDIKRTDIFAKTYMNRGGGPKKALEYHYDDKYGKYVKFAKKSNIKLSGGFHPLIFSQMGNIAKQSLKFIKKIDEYSTEHVNRIDYIDEIEKEDVYSSTRVALSSIAYKANYRLECRSMAKLKL